MILGIVSVSAYNSIKNVDETPIQNIETSKPVPDDVIVDTGTGDVEEEKPEVDITKKYRLVNVIGAGSQLQATIEDLSSGQTKRVNVGKKLDGFTIKSISLDDGVVVVGEDGITQNLNISNGK